MSRRIPLFPLPGVVLLPGTMLPLHIFEARYRAMVADALEGDRTIGMAMLKPGAEGPEPPRIHAVGGAGEIIESERLEDGRYNILLEGRFRYRVLEEAPPDPYRVARVEEIRSVPFPQPEERDRVLRAVVSLFTRDRRSARSAPASGRGPRARAAGLGARDPPALHPGRASGDSRDRLSARPVRDAQRQDAGMERAPAPARAVPAEGSGPATELTCGTLVSDERPPQVILSEAKDPRLDVRVWQSSPGSFVAALLRMTGTRSTVDERCPVTPTRSARARGPSCGWP